MNTRLLILGVLADGPMHGYEIHRWMTRTRTALWADVKPGSLYHALKQLTAEGLAEVADVEHQGDRSRTVYRITRTGRSELTRLLRKGWSQPPRSYPSDLYVLLTFAGRMKPADLAIHVHAARERLAAVLEQWTAGVDEKLEAVGSDPLIAAMIDNGRAHLEADLALLDAISRQ